MMSLLRIIFFEYEYIVMIRVVWLLTYAIKIVGTFIIVIHAA